MTDDVQRRLTALEQKVGTEQAMRIALLTDITARLDMLEHKAGESPPADPAAEVPLTREEAEEIAKTCARIAAARPQAPSDLATVNMRGWRPHAWVVDAVLDGACRSRVGQARTEGAIAELRAEHERDQQAIALRIAKIVGVYRDDDDDEFDLDTLLGMLETKVTQLRQDACGACDAQRAAVEERDQLRDQRNAMSAERDQALASVRELEEQISDMQSSVDRTLGELDQARLEFRHLRDARSREFAGLADANTRLRADVASMSGDIAAVLTATGTRTIGEAVILISKLKADNQALRERHDQLFSGAQQAYQEREAEHRALLQAQADVVRLKEWSGELDDSLHEVCALLGVESHRDAPGAIRALKAESIADVMAKLEQLRGQVANMHASQRWLDSYERLERQIADALGISADDAPSVHAMLDRVRQLAAKAAIGVTHE